MDKIQKYEFVKKSREYLEERKITDLFKNLTKQLIIHRPDSPIDFLIDRIQKKEPIRVFIVGPPGSKAKLLARRLSKDIDFTTISAGELLRKESSRLNETPPVADDIDQFRIVNDKNLSHLVKYHILKNENEGKNWILEGYPKTKSQVLNLQRIGIIPDVIVLLEEDRVVSLDKIKRNISEANPSPPDESKEDGEENSEEKQTEVAEQILSEYDLQIAQVKDSYSKFLNIFSATKPMDEMEKDLMQMVKKKVDNPLLPPGITIERKEE